VNVASDRVDKLGTPRLGRVAPNLSTLIHPLPTLRRTGPAADRERLRRNNNRIFHKFSLHPLLTEGFTSAPMALRAGRALFSGQVLQDLPRTEQRITPAGYIITRDGTTGKQLEEYARLDEVRQRRQAALWRVLEIADAYTIERSAAPWNRDSLYER